MKNYLFVVSGDRNEVEIINDMCKFGATVTPALERDVFYVFDLPEGIIETIIGIESYDTL